MNPLRCDEVKNSLIDYLEFELPLARREHLFEHISQCADCQAVHDELQQTLAEVKKIKIAEPSQNYWDSLPESVLREVKESQSQRRDKDISEVESHEPENQVFNGIYDDDRKVISFKQAVKNKNAAQSGNNGQDKHEQNKHVHSSEHAPKVDLVKTTNNPATNKWPKVAFPIAAAILIGLGATFSLLEREYLTVQESVGFQAQIQSDRPLVELAQKLVPLSQSNQLFGFASQQGKFSGFFIGSKFSEVTVYANSDQHSLLNKQLEKLNMALRSEHKAHTNVIAGIDRLQNELKTQGELVNAYPALVQLFGQYVSSVKAQDPEHYQLVVAGAWLFDYALAVLARDDASIRQLDQLSGLVESLRAITPPGVVQSLNKVHHIVQQPVFTDRDYNNILKEIQNVRSLLG